MSKQLRSDGKKLRLGIFRGLDVRFANAEFAANFKTFEPIFIGKFDEEIKFYLDKKRVRNINLSLKQALPFDPINLFFGKKTHQSWLVFEKEKLSKAIKNIDVVEIYEPYFFDSAQVAKEAKKQNKFVVTEIWTSFTNHPANFIPPYSFHVRNVIKKTDLFILRSKKVFSYLEPFNVPKHKKVLIYPGVDLKKFYPAKKSTKDGRVRILFVGVLGKHKGLDDIMSVFPALAKKYEGKIELLICGDGILKKEVLRMTKFLPVRFFGKVPHSKIPAIFSEADIFCGPSKEYFSFGIKRWEEFVGYTFMEAMASGLPIVSAKCGGIPEIVGKDNILIRQGDRKQLFYALKKYIENPNLREETGNKNRKRAEQFFDLKKQVSLTEKIIDSYFTKNERL